MMERSHGSDKVEPISKVIVHEIGFDKLDPWVERFRLCSFDHRSIRVYSRHSDPEPIRQTPGKTAVTTSNIQGILAIGRDVTQKQVCVVLIVIVSKHSEF